MVWAKAQTPRRAVYHQPAAHHQSRTSPQLNPVVAALRAQQAAAWISPDERCFAELHFVFLQNHEQVAELMWMRNSRSNKGDSACVSIRVFVKSRTMSRPFNAPDVYRAIADPSRRRILELLHQSDRSPGELLPFFRLSKPSLSQHLRTLRLAGLIRERRRGKGRPYIAAPQALRVVATWVLKLTSA